MARDLAVRVSVSGVDKANRDLRSVDRSIDQIDKTGEKVNNRLEDTAKRMDGVGMAGAGMGKSIAATALGFIAAQAAIMATAKAMQALTDSLRLAAEQEQVTARLSAALVRQGGDVEALRSQYEELARGIQSYTAFSDEALQQSAATFTTIGKVGPEMMGRALQAATDLAAGLEIDLARATERVARGVRGNVEELRRYGLQIDEAAVKAGGAGVVFGAVHDTFGGQATAQLDTYAGEVAQIGNLYAELKERAGDVVLQSPILEAALRGVRDVLIELNAEGAKVPTTFAAFAREKIPAPLLALLSATPAGAVFLGSAVAEAIEGQFAAANAAAERAAGLLESFRQRTSLGQIGGDDLGWAAMLEADAKAADAAAKALEEQARRIGAALDLLFGAAAIQKAQDYMAALGDVANVADLTDEAQLTLNRTMQAAADAYIAADRPVPQYIADLLQATNATQGLTMATLGLREGLAGLSLPGAMTLQGPPGGPGLLHMGIPGIPGIPTILPNANNLPGAIELQPPEGMEPGFFSQFGSFMAGNLPSIITSTFAGRGGLGGSIGSGMGGQLLGQFTKAGGGKIGGLLGSILPGIGTLAGGLLGSLVGGLFGPSEGEQVNDMRDQFIAAAGGLHELNVQATEAGLTLDELLRADSVEEYERAIQSLDAGMAEFTRKQQEAAQLLRDQIEAVKTAGGALADRVGITAGQFEGKSRDDLSAGQLGRLGRDVARQGMLAESLFREQLQLTDDYAASLDAVGPALDQIIDLQDRFGLTVSESTQKLLDQRRIMVENEDQIAAIDAITRIVTSLGDSGLLTAQQFNQMNNDMKRQFDQLQKNGATSEQALRAILPALIAINDASQEYGFKLDDRTQKLVDQAREQGLLKDQTKTDAESMVTDISKVETATDLVAAAWLKVKGDMESVDWEAMKNEALRNLRPVRDEIDGMALGSSPGGIKEWVLKLDEFAERLSDIRAQGEADLAALRGEVEGLTDRQRELISSAIELGLSYDDISKSVGASTAALEEFNKQQQEAAKLAEQQYADYLRAKEEDARGLASLADIQRGIEEDLALQGKTGLEAEMIRLDQERRALYRQVEALRATAGDEAVDAVRDMIHQLFQLREGEAIANDALNNAPGPSSGQGGISLSRTFLTPLESVTGVQTQVGSGGHTFNLTINATTAEGGEAAAEALLETLRRRGVPIRA